MALDASGDGNYGQVANNAVLRPAGDFTLELFARPDFPHSGTDPAADEIVVMKNDNLGTAIVSYGIGWVADSSSFFALSRARSSSIRRRVGGLRPSGFER